MKTHEEPELIVDFLGLKSVDVADVVHVLPSLGAGLPIPDYNANAGGRGIGPAQLVVPGHAQRGQIVAGS